MSHERHVAAGPEEMAAAAAAHIARELRAAVEARGSCSLVLAGGGTPRPVYARLAATPELPWEQVEVFFGDERCVPPDDPQSNYRMARETLLDAVRPGQVHRMRGEDPDREAAARAYAALLPEPLDLVLLGMGADGHTASLFPGQAALTEGERRVVVVQGPKPPPWRLSLAPPALERARQLVVLVRGAAKAAVVARALADEGSLNALPVRLARRGAWFLDAAAAASLPPDPPPGSSP